MNSDLITAFDPKYEIGKKRENKNNERLRKNEIRKRRKVDDWRNRGNGETRCESSGNLHLKRSSSLGIEFCVGDRFYLCENKILCEYDYEERLVFANMALHPPPTATLAHIKRQVTHLQPQVS
ncbi:hypothetical protein KQX54_018026 [Cotesia glomerata]|uniref:Uncharacterized protein n=1 Tax=Cotesia glomerata TaxID=32391 RepID=A0AAV7HYW4_COTGL|nr:hypothetical protein KQX54_018026 [Cotesia glomerata]